MRRILPYLFLLLLTATSCVDNDTYDDNPQGNLEALWRILDEHYCFFEEKGVDWNAVHEKYAVRMNAEMSESQQFEVMTQMISELRDGHVNLYTTFNTGRYWSWKEDYPTNFSDTLLRRYLRTDYLIAGGTDYTILDDNIGYLRYESFQQGMSDANLDQVMLHMAGCNGLIIDVRGNGGGLMTHAERLRRRASATRRPPWATCATRRDAATRTSRRCRSRGSAPPRDYAGRRRWWCSPTAESSLPPTSL